MSFECVIIKKIDIILKYLSNVQWEPATSNQEKRLRMELGVVLLYSSGTGIKCFNERISLLEFL